MKKYVEGESCPECRAGNLKREENSKIVLKSACVGMSERMEGPLSIYTHLKCTSCNRDFCGEVYIPSEEEKAESLKSIESVLRLTVNNISE